MIPNSAPGGPVAGTPTESSADAAFREEIRSWLADHLTGEWAALKGLGGPGRDRVKGGSGKDRIKPGPGGDKVNSGSGNDRITSVDFRRDVVRCGGGVDRVTADRSDRVKRSCEKVVLIGRLR